MAPRPLRPTPDEPARGVSGPARPRALYVISVVAQITGLHPQTLRHYERLGLVHPDRTAGGSRRFSDADLARLTRILELSATGCNLHAIRRILELEDQLATLRAQLSTE